MLAVLRRRDFFLLWLAGLVSVAGDWVLMTALPFYVYVETGSTLATAGMTAAELAPAILLTSPAGVFVDRWDRKRVLVVTNLLQAATVAALLLVGDGQLWVVYVVAAAQSSVAAFAGPAEAALLPTLVPRDQLVQANALNVLNNRLGRLAGVPLGAALLSWWGLEVVVVVDVVTFAWPPCSSHRSWPRARPCPRTQRCWASGGSGWPAWTWCGRTGRSRCCSWCSG